MAIRIAINMLLIWIAGAAIYWFSRPVEVTPVHVFGAALLAIPFAFLMDARWLAYRQRDRIRAQRRDADK